MGSRPDTGPPPRGPRRLALAAMAVGVGLLASVALLAALGVIPVSAQRAPCDQIPPVAVHYETAVGRYPGVTSLVAVSGVVLSDFPSACEGHTVTLQMWGNSAGDPSVALSSDRLLSTADSALAPCTQDSLSSPLVVAGGSITLSLCATGGPAGYVSAHDLTALSLLVSAGASQGQVKAQSTTAPPPSPLSPPGRHGGTLGVSTPSSGAQLPLPLAQFLIVLGLALILVGLWSWGRRRDPSQG